MELSLLLGKQIIALFLIGVVGYVIVKINLLHTEDSQILSKICVYVCSPCVTIEAFQIECTASKVKGLLLAMAAAAVLHFVYISLTKILSRPLGFNSVERASIVYSNAGNLVIPLVAATFGTEWVFYTSAYIAVQTVLIWTHGKALICHSEDNSLKKIIMNPNIIAMIIGAVLFAANISLPDIVGTTVSSLGSMIGPVSMLVIGMLIGNVDLKWVFRQKRVYFVCLFRLIVLPVISVLLIKISGASRFHPEAGTILLIVLLAGASSVAAMVTQLAQVFGGDAKYASVINVMSVIFCVVTMPFIVLLYDFIL